MRYEIRHLIIRVVVFETSVGVVLDVCVEHCFDLCRDRRFCCAIRLCDVVFLVCLVCFFVLCLHHSCGLSLLLGQTQSVANSFFSLSFVALMIVQGPLVAAQTAHVKALIANTC